MPLRPLRIPFIAAGSLLLAACSHPTEPDSRLLDPLVSVAVVRNDTSDARYFTGIVATRVQSDQGFRVTGKITQRLVDVGQVVKRGQVLMRLDPIDLNLGVAAQQGAVDAARAHSIQADADEARMHGLVEQGAISAQAYDQVVAAARSSKAELVAAQALAAVAKNAGQYSVLVADVDGTIVSTHGDPGQVVEAGQTVIRIAKDGPREAAINLPETLRPALGSVAEARLYGNAEHTYPAHLRELSDAADPVTRTFAARYVLEDAAKDAPLGATVTVGLAGQQDNAFLVPLGALLDQGKDTGVWVLDEKSSTVSLHTLQVSGLSEEYARVIGAIHAGDRIIAMGAHLLHANQKVRIAEVVAVSP